MFSRIVLVIYGILPKDNLINSNSIKFFHFTIPFSKSLQFSLGEFKKKIKKKVNVKVHNSLINGII